MNLSQSLVIRKTNHFFDSVIEARENREDCSHGKNVVEVGNNVISQDVNLSYDKDWTRSSSRQKGREVARIVSTDPAFVSIFKQFPRYCPRGLLSCSLQESAFRDFTVSDKNVTGARLDKVKPHGAMTTRHKKLNNTFRGT